MLRQEESAIRVVRVITRLNVGGPSIQASTLSHRLSARGFDTLLVHGRLGEGEGDMRYLVGEEARTRYLPALRRPVAPAHDALALAQLVDVMRDVRPHIVHTHMAKAGTLGRIAAAIYNNTAGRGAHARVVHTYHGHVLDGYFSLRTAALFTAAERQLARVTDAIVAISQQIRNELLSGHRIGRADQYCVIPLGFDLSALAAIGEADRRLAREALGIDASAHVVSTVGRLTAIKRHALFLETAALVAAQDPAAQFLIAGDGELRAELEQAARALGLASRVRFLGWRRDLATIYGATDVFLLTSRNEGTPVALIESLAAAVPGVSTDVGGIRDVVDSDEVGLLAPLGYAALLAAHVSALLAARWASADANRSLLGTHSIVSWTTSSGSIANCCTRISGMLSRRSLWIVCALALANGLFFIWYQSSDWNASWSDQDGYRRLGQVLATTGKFTRFPDALSFVPEVIRTPAYPLFVAAIYRVFGAGQLPVALAQTALFVAICLLVYAIAARIVSKQVAWWAALVTALYPPIPYFGALVMTEVWTTMLFTLAAWLTIRALDTESMAGFALAGVTLGLTALSRPAFALFPFALAAVSRVVAPFVGRRTPVRLWAVMIAVFAVTMLPWFTYNYRTLGVFTLSPAGGVGRGIWEGSWQARWSGRLQNELTHLADDIDDRRELDARVAAVAAREQLSPEPMLTYVHQWEDIRRIWTEPADSSERARARVQADGEYLRVGLNHIKAEPTGALVHRLARGVFILWAGEIPFRYSEINHLPRTIIYVCWAIQAVVGCLAVAGLVALARHGRAPAAVFLATPIVYITAVHFPLLTEARQSLPAQPVVLLLATIGVAWLTGHLFPLEAQVHEGQHL
jgi:glycosyltransferase involved in cell wall biosynthesis